MNQKKNYGFTLIELLAVIIILAIIALIAVPVIMNIINKANKSAFKDSAYGVISAGELYFSEQQLEPNGMLEDITITLPDTTNKLQLKGEVPTGSILITKEGKVAIAVHNNRYCVTKGIEDKDVKVTEDYESCDLPSGENQGGNTPQAGSIKSLATTSTEVTTIPACINDGTECTPGTAVAIKVNSTEVYNFYVISETNNEIILLMDRNLGGNVAWISEEDYGCGVEGDMCSLNDKGPRTAVAALKERTSGWTNIPERVYTYSDDGGGNKYPSFTETMRARMLTRTEGYDKFNEMPSWMYINVTSDARYWVSSADNESNTTSPNVDHRGGFGIGIGVYDNTVNGVRPVITLSK